MYKELKTRLINSLKAELDYVAKSETDYKIRQNEPNQKLNKIN